MKVTLNPKISEELRFSGLESLKHSSLVYFATSGRFANVIPLDE